MGVTIDVAKSLSANCPHNIITPSSRCIDGSSEAGIVLLVSDLANG